MLITTRATRNPARNRTDLYHEPAVKRLKVLLKRHTYAQAAEILASEGFKTPRGLRPKADYVNHLVTRFHLGGLERTIRYYGPHRKSLQPD